MSLAEEGKVEHREGIVTRADLPEGFLHLVVFGPGHGEAVLVRMPDGRVGVVDGCGEPPAANDRGSPLFSLVKELDEKRLLFGCVTHPHQDHIGGFARLIKEHPPEHLWWSGSRERKFFEHYLAWLKRRGQDRRTGDKEPPARGLARLVRAISAACQPGAPTRPQQLEDRKRLLPHRTAHGEVVVEGLLPSSSGVLAAERDALAALDGGRLDDPRRLFDPNRISGALLITWGKTRILLGGDALCETDPHAGWDGLLEPIDKVTVVKVPHHASRGAHSERRWAEMQPDLAVVTCVQNASNDQPPRPEMLEKLLRSGCELALTSQPAWWTDERHGLVERPRWAAPRRPADRRSSGIPSVKRSITTSPAANKHQNAVVVRLDGHGTIVRVQLHGAARHLQRREGK